MWFERLAFAPLALQNLLCPSRSSDTILLFALGWICGALFGALITALALSPGLRRCILRGLLVALQETVVVGENPRGGVDRLQRYRGQ